MPMKHQIQPREDALGRVVPETEDARFCEARRAKRTRGYGRIVRPAGVICVFGLMGILRDPWTAEELKQEVPCARAEKFGVR